MLDQKAKALPCLWSWGKNQDKFNPNVLTCKRRPPPNPETPGQHVALDTPRRPRGSPGSPQPSFLGS